MIHANVGDGIAEHASCADSAFDLLLAVGTGSLVQVSIDALADHLSDGSSGFGGNPFESSYLLSG